MRKAHRLMLRTTLQHGRQHITFEAGSDNHSTDASPATSRADDISEDGLEPWHEWLQRVTHEAEEALAAASIEGWIVQQRRRFFRWAGHVARRTDNRWSTAVLWWNPADHQSKHMAGIWRQARPHKRWDDPLNSFFEERACFPAGQWKHVAQDRAVWISLEDDFAEGGWR